MAVEQDLDLPVLNFAEYNLNNIENGLKLEDCTSWEITLNQLLEQNHHVNLSAAPPDWVTLPPKLSANALKTNNIINRQNHSIKLPGGHPDGTGYGNFGGGGSGGNNGDAWMEDFGGINPAVSFVIWLGLLLLAFWICNKIFQKYLEELQNLNKYLNSLTQKNPKDTLTKVYSIFVKCFAGFLSFLVSPEALASALRILGGPRVRNILRILSFLFRGAILGSLFLGGTPYLINWYQYLMRYLGPVLAKTINILAGPQNIPLSVLFIEKVIKCMLASLCFGGVCVFIRKLKNSPKVPSAKNKPIHLLCLVGLVCSVYFVLTDFIYIRKFAGMVAKHNLIAPLVVSPFGRMSLVIGSLLFMRPFSFLPGVPVMFIVLLYGLGVYNLAFRL